MGMIRSQPHLEEVAQGLGIGTRPALDGPGVPRRRCGHRNRVPGGCWSGVYRAAPALDFAGYQAVDDMSPVPVSAVEEVRTLVKFTVTVSSIHGGYRGSWSVVETSPVTMTAGCDRGSRADADAPATRRDVLPETRPRVTWPCSDRGGRGPPRPLIYLCAMSQRGCTGRRATECSTSAEDQPKSSGHTRAKRDVGDRGQV